MTNDELLTAVEASGITPTQLTDVLKYSMTQVQIVMYDAQIAQLRAQEQADIQATEGKIQELTAYKQALQAQIVTAVPPAAIVAPVEL